MNTSRLSAELYESIVVSLRSDGARGNHENRLMPRVGLRAKIDIVPSSCDDTGAKKITVWLRDISAGGLGIVTSQYLSEKTEFTAIFNRERNDILKIPYVVTHCLTLSKGLFSIGAMLKK